MPCMRVKILNPEMRACPEDPSGIALQATASGCVGSALNAREVCDGKVSRGQEGQGVGDRSQHPLSDAPAISLRFTEPPSDEGTGGGQMGGGGPGAAAVVLAPWLELPGFSPGICNGVSGFVDGAALIAPGEALVDPFGVSRPDPVGLPDKIPGKEGEANGKEAVGRVSGSELVALWLSACVFGCKTVCACAVASLRKIVNMIKARCITLSCCGLPALRLAPCCKTTRGRQNARDEQRKGDRGEPRLLSHRDRRLTSA
jgi:hypothetical protein